MPEASRQNQGYPATCSVDPSRSQHAGIHMSLRAFELVWIRFRVSVQTRHLRKVVFSSGKSLKVLTTVASS